jgi:hypothetical protein
VNAGGNENYETLSFQGKQPFKIDEKRPYLVFVIASINY